MTAKIDAVLAGKFRNSDEEFDLEWADDAFEEMFGDAPEGPKMVVSHTPDGRTFMRSEGVVRARMAQAVRREVMPDGEADFASEAHISPVRER